MNINQLSVGMPSKVIADCMATFKKQVPAGVTLTMLEGDPFAADMPGLVPIKDRSDYIRLMLGKADPTSMWVDRDVRLRTVKGISTPFPVIPADGKARFYTFPIQHGSSVMMYSPCVIAWNGDTLAADMLNVLLANPGDYPNHPISRMLKLPQFAGRVLPMPAGFVHLCESVHSMWNQGVREIRTAEISITGKDKVTVFDE